MWQISGFIFTCIAGTLLHFVYEWSGENIIASVFSGTNESTWEHMKILFIPMFVFAILQKHLMGDDLKNYWCVKLKGVVLGISLIPIMFYTFNGAFGQTKAWMNIAIFYLSAAISYIYEYKSFKKEKSCFWSQTMAFSFLCIIALAFLVFTFVQPNLLIFKDPITGTTGI